MQKNEVIAFFDSWADVWDEHQKTDPEKLNLILDNANICAGKKVLDVGCGTGVLEPFFLERKVKSVKAVDISSRMIQIAVSKFNEENVEFVCGDIETFPEEEKFDCVIVYNALPHFADTEVLVGKLLQLLVQGGTLSIAHSMSREKLLEHHNGSAKKVSVEIPEVRELAELIKKADLRVRVTTMISDEKMYQLSVVKNL